MRVYVYTHTYLHTNLHIYVHTCVYLHIPRYVGECGRPGGASGNGADSARECGNNWGATVAAAPRHIPTRTRAQLGPN